MAVTMRIVRLTARSVRSGMPSLQHRASCPISFVNSLATRPRVAYRLVSQLSAANSTVDEPCPHGPSKPKPWSVIDLTEGASGFRFKVNPHKVTMIPSSLPKDPETGKKYKLLPMPHLWLRDNCRCSQCFNQATKQRSFSIFDIPSKIYPTKILVESEGLRITWDHELHESFYDWSFLKRHTYGRHMPEFDMCERRQFWGSEIAENPPTVTYEEVMDTTSESGMAKLTDHLVRHGLVFVDNTPFDDAIHTKYLLERIGPIRETHYGGFYDFVPDMAKADTAYTNIALPAHTDTTYFTDPAGLQAFHMLSHTALEGSPPTGGESLLVDGFHAAEIMRKEHKHEFQVLKTCSVPWHASGNQGVTITPGVQECVIRSYATPKAESPIYRIKWNNDDRGVMRLTQNTRNVAAWYGAARKFNDILKRTSSEYWFQLKPGRTLIFDNYRVLHGRSAFTGLRRMCGGYISRDDFVSRWRNTNFARDEVLAQVLG